MFWKWLLIPLLLELENIPSFYNSLSKLFQPRIFFGRALCYHFYLGFFSLYLSSEIHSSLEVLSAYWRAVNKSDKFLKKQQSSEHLLSGSSLKSLSFNSHFPMATKLTYSHSLWNNQTEFQMNPHSTSFLARGKCKPKC